MITQHCKMYDLEPWKYPKQILVLVVLLLFTAFGIMVYGTYRCRVPEFEDPFTRSIAGEEQHHLNQFIDGWGWIHFWFFAMLSFLFPTCWKELFAAGLIWEIIEMMFKEHPFYLTDCHSSIHENKAGWWYGRWEDLVMNSLGILLGLYLYNRHVPFSIFPIGFVVIITGHVGLQKIQNNSPNKSIN